MRVGAVTSNGRQFERDQCQRESDRCRQRHQPWQPAAKTLAAVHRQLTAVASYSDGSSQNITAPWSPGAAVTATSPPSAPVVKSLAVSPGTAVITGSFGGQVSILDRHNVTAATVSAIQISTPLTSLALGTNGQLKALATYSDDTLVDVTVGQISWSSSARRFSAWYANGQSRSCHLGSAVTVKALAVLPSSAGSLGGTQRHHQHRSDGGDPDRAHHRPHSQSGERESGTNSRRRPVSAT